MTETLTDWRHSPACGKQDAAPCTCKAETVCAWASPFGRYCEKSYGHTGNHKCVVFSALDAERAWLAKGRA